MQYTHDALLMILAAARSWDLAMQPVILAISPREVVAFLVVLLVQFVLPAILFFAVLYFVVRRAVRQELDRRESGTAPGDRATEGSIE